jgi:hypothetical protein
MYLAELHSKLSPKTERLEDLLTSNVFSFFKYSDREVFLKEYLRMLGFSVSSKEAREAEFIFWPRYEQNTEPDLVIRVGRYYILIEAKYFSDFGEGSDDIKHQLIREIECGSLDAKNYSQEFFLVAITADYYYKEDKFGVIPNIFRPNFKWTNWQKVTSFLELALEGNSKINTWEYDFASDLCNLLDRKNLRSFNGLNNLSYLKLFPNSYDSIFLEAKTVKFRGAFIGFINSLSLDEEIKPIEKIFLVNRQFWGTLKLDRALTKYSNLFYEEK